MNKHFLSLLLGGIYIVTMIVPYYVTSVKHMVDPKHTFFILHGGILHVPSLLFIGLSAILLHLSVQSKTNDASLSHQNARKYLNDAIDSLNLDNENPAQKLVKSTNPYCSDIRSMIKMGGTEEDMELVVQKRVFDISTSYEKLIAEYSYIATVLPMLGMLGTITGLLQMFAIGNGVDNFAEKLASLSVALATTLYATVFVIFITKPKGREIENWLIELDDNERRLIIQSKLFLHNVDLMSEIYEEESEKDSVDVQSQQKEKSSGHYQ